MQSPINYLFRQVNEWFIKKSIDTPVDVITRSPSNFFINTGYQRLMGGLMLMIGSFIFGESWSFPTSWSSDVQWSMVLLILFGSIVAFTSFNYLLRIVSPEKVATSTYVNPIIALILGWYFLNEQITTQSIIAAMILLTGVYFINTKKTFVIFERFLNKQTQILKLFDFQQSILQFL